MVGLLLPWASAGRVLTPSGRCAATLGCEPGPGGELVRSFPTRSGLAYLGDAAIVIAGAALLVAVLLVVAPDRRLTSGLSTGLGAVVLVVAATSAYAVVASPSAPSYIQQDATIHAMVGLPVTALGAATLIGAGLFTRDWRHAAWIGLTTVGLVVVAYPLVTVQFVDDPEAWSPYSGYFHATLGIDAGPVAIIAVGVVLVLVGALFRTRWLDRHVPSTADL